MDDLKMCFVVMGLGAWFGFGFNWGRWIWSNLSAIWSDFRRWRTKRHNSTSP